MGTCLCKGHKELQSAQQHPMEVLQSQPGKGGHPPSNCSMSEKKSSSSYDIGELATSSLMGLVVMIKEHITKPTAMAQGRVAHLIEWKGWGGGGEGGGDLQEDEQLYSHLTDEIKEARFAAGEQRGNKALGVAEQFALAEAAMNVWSMHEGPEQPSSSLDPLQDVGSVGLPQHLYSIHTKANNNYDAGSLGPPHPAFSVSPISPPSQQDSERRPPEDGRSGAAEATTVRHVDSSSLYEDEVFYN
ncbi:hypothetical protein J4Q44_G00259980 [Coregonus suidteri]|uniref:Family with sequence similarity 131 member C n=1 Tax=Coregonus suidteri TaxID=861788 RepID=A0AAN8QFA4_9TELE